MSEKRCLFIGIDPGKTGAIAIIDNDKNCVLLQNWHNISFMTDIILGVKNRKSSSIFQVCIEKVNSYGQGRTSAFTFGENYGMYQGILSALLIPYTFVTPQKWQKAIFDSKGGKNTKERSLNMARRLYPLVDLRYKKDHNKADALLIARYARQIYKET